VNDKQIYVSDIIQTKLDDIEYKVDMQLFLTIFHLLTLEERVFYLNQIIHHKEGLSFAKEILCSYHNRKSELEYLLNRIDIYLTEKNLA